MTRTAPAVPRLLSVLQMAQACSVCTRTVIRWIKSGDLPHHRFGRTFRIAEDDARRFIAARRQ